MLFIYINGFVLCLSLIVAIGAQNLFIIEQGLAKNHIFWVCLISFLGDCLIIALGVFGIGSVVIESKYFIMGLGLVGIIFLLYYGASSLKSAIKGTNFAKISQAKNTSLKQTVLKSAALSLLNPHVYIDAFVIIGAFSINFSNTAQIAFYFGAITASFLWFFSLGYICKALSRFFTNPKIWRILDFCVALMMLYLAYLLMMFVLK
ncbi:MAG: LysE family transporter [Campylobacter sp.]|nr:LysE family transporter [Campylobacter sp.]